MSKLKQEWVEEELQKLQPWRDDAWERAKERAQGHEAAQPYLEQIASEELTEAQWSVAWELYDAAHDMLCKAAHEQVKGMRVNWAEVGDDVDGLLPGIWIRILAKYDAERAKLTTYAYKATQRRIWREIQSDELSETQRKILSAVKSAEREAGRELSMAEKAQAVEHLKTSEEGVAAALRSKRSKKSLDEGVTGDEGDDRTVQDVLPAREAGSIDTRRVGRVIAEETDRLELWQRLIDEEPTSPSFSRAEARTILLELRARRADPQKVAWEHETSPYVVCLLDKGEGPYDLDVSGEEILRYREAQGYEPGGQAKRLPDWEVQAIRELYEEGENKETLAELAWVSEATIRNVVRGDAAYSDLDPVRTYLEEEEEEEIFSAEKARRRYQQEDITQDELAEEVPVSRTTLSKMLRGVQAYSHLDSVTETGERPLPLEDATELRKEYAEGATYDDLKQEYDLHEQRVAEIVKGRGKYSELEEAKRKVDPTQGVSNETARDIRKEWRVENPTMASLSERYPASTTTIRKVLKAEGCYSDLGDSIRYIHQDEDDEMADTEKKALRARIERLESIISKASADITAEKTEEIRDHFSDLGLTREQLEGVHELNPITIELALMGDGYAGMEDLTEDEDHENAS